MKINQYPFVALAKIIAEATPGFACGQRDPKGIAQVRMHNISKEFALVWETVTRIPKRAFKPQHYLLPGDIVFNNTNSTALVGKSALFVGGKEPIVFSNHMTRLRVDREICLPEFLLLYLRDRWNQGLFSRICARWIGQSAIRSAKLMQLSIPLPPMAEQRRIVARLRQELQNCDEICRAAESRIDRIRALFSAWVRIVFDKFERASWVKFSDIAEINPRRGSFEGRLKNEDMATFIPMSAVDSTAGEVSSPLVRPFSEVCKGYTFFRDGDVLFAKITPCMQNGNHFVAKNGINGFGFASTEFYVIRSGNMVLPEWIHLFIRQPSILRAAMRQFRGSAGQQRVPPKFLADLRIPLPSIPRQRRIVAQACDQFQDWQKLTASANTQLESARALPQAFLRRAFS